MIFRKIFDILRNRQGLRKRTNRVTADSTQPDKQDLPEPKQQVLQKRTDRVSTDSVQLEKQESPKRKQQLIIGLDFGTAFTKVVVGEQRVRYAVPFDPYACDANSYLLPSVLSIDNDQKCTLGFSGVSGHRIEDLKMRLINRDFSPETKIDCVAFLALVLSHVRGWLLKTHESTYRGRQIIWFVNIGLPTDEWDDTELVSVYKEIVRVAWAASTLPNPISLEQIRDCFENEALGTITGRSLPSEQINAFPEFAVQLMGYIQSPQRQENLHALADVGAGTLDFTTFNVWRDQDEEDQFPVFTRGVKPFGTQFFVRHRLNSIQPSPDWNPSPYEDVPPDSDFEEHLSLNNSELWELDIPFREEIEDLIRGRLMDTRERIPHWPYGRQFGVPTFLCGGGATIEFYRKIFHAFEETYPPFRIDLRSLHEPEDLQLNPIQEGTYDRLSVAYGLSFGPDNIAETIVEFEDHEPEPPEERGDRYIGNEQI